MALLQLPNTGTWRDGCRPLTASLGKRKRKEGWQRVNGKEVTLWSSVSLIMGYLSTSPWAHPIPCQPCYYPTASCCKLFPEQV